MVWHCTSCGLRPGPQPQNTIPVAVSHLCSQLPMPTLDCLAGLRLVPLSQVPHIGQKPSYLQSGSGLRCRLKMVNLLRQFPIFCLHSPCAHAVFTHDKILCIEKGITGINVNAMQNRSKNLSS